MPELTNHLTHKNTRELYPPVEPYSTGRLQVSPIHNIYFEECGSTNGTPVVFLHGGPGAGLDADYRRFFDPAGYRIVLFDQRGSGQSTPYGCLEENTTWDLVADIERLREHLGIERWVVFGGSWGSTLAMAYAESHPERVRALVLRGIFFGSRRENDWGYRSGTNAIFPDAWGEFVKVIPEGERTDIVNAYYRRLTSEDKNVSREAARAWSVWEGSTSKLIPDPNLIERFAEIDFALAIARIECHYFTNNCFMPSDNYLLENVSRIRSIPTVIVQGRYDVLCPMTNAWLLHKAFSEAELVIVPDAGHSGWEKGTLSALVEATDRFRDAL
jgi:proline iminopeptidase